MGDCVLHGPNIGSGGGAFKSSGKISIRTFSRGSSLVLPVLYSARGDLVVVVTRFHQELCYFLIDSVLGAGEALGNEIQLLLSSGIQHVGEVRLQTQIILLAEQL